MLCEFSLTSAIKPCRDTYLSFWKISHKGYLRWVFLLTIKNTPHHLNTPPSSGYFSDYLQESFWFNLRSGFWLFKNSYRSLWDECLHEYTQDPPRPTPSENDKCATYRVVWPWHDDTSHDGSCSNSLSDDRASPLLDANRVRHHDVPHGDDPLEVAQCGDVPLLVGDSLRNRDGCYGDEPRFHEENGHLPIWYKEASSLVIPAYKGYFHCETKKRVLWNKCSSHKVFFIVNTFWILNDTKQKYKDEEHDLFLL